MRPLAGLIRAYLLAFVICLIPALAAAAPTWTQMTSNTTMQPNANATSVVATLGSSALPVTSVPKGALIALIVHSDANGGVHSAVDSAGDVFKLGPDSGIGGQAETALLYTITSRALTTGDTITYSNTIIGFYTLDLEYLSGSAAGIVPGLDGSSAHAFGSNVTTAPSGAVTGSQPHDAAIGGATNKFGGGNQTQSAGFSTPPAQPSSGNKGYIAGTAIDAGTSSFNYSPNSSPAQSPLSSIVALFTTEAPPFQPHFPAAPVISPNSDQAPDVAKAAGLTLNTYNLSTYSCLAPGTVDCNYTFNLGYTLYCASSFNTGCVTGSITVLGTALQIKEADGNGGAYQDTAPTWGVGQAGGSTHVGKAFRGDAYYECTASFTSQDTTSSGTWYAPCWGYAAGGILPTLLPDAEWPGYPSINMNFEFDWELFGNNFVANLVNGYYSVHVHYGTTHQLDFQSQLVYTPACVCTAFWQSNHRFGFHVKSATSAQAGYIEGEIDGASVGQIPFTLFIFREIAAGVVNTGDTTITMTTPSPSTGIVHGYSLINQRTGVMCGPINDYTSTAVHLQSGSLCSGIGGDTYQLVPPPPPLMTGGGYVSLTGVATFIFASDPAIAVGAVPTFAPTNSGPNLLCSTCTVLTVNTSTNTVTAQYPTGLGNGTVTGGQYLPSWFYGVVQEQAQYLTSGYPDASPGVEVKRTIWQLPVVGDDLNIQPF